ncbi:MAG: metallophosphoesterase [Candidatus Brocadiales bacterium]|nr:metallophosphoesterase [Candidatus Brocadiales bacterium]
MAKEKVKIFMSDMHLGDGGLADDFTPKKEATFVKILNELSQAYGKGSELIMLGDIFDVIEQKEEEPEKAIKISIAVHNKYVSALRSWLRQGNKLFYITGNHDHALRRANVVKVLAYKLMEKTKDTDRDIPWGRFVVDDWYASKRYKIYAEHGNRFDPTNNHGGLEDCFGDKLVRRVLRPLEAATLQNQYAGSEQWKAPEGWPGKDMFSILDNIRPRENIMDFIDYLVDNKFLKGGFTDNFKNKVVDLYKEHPDPDWITSMLAHNEFLRFMITDKTFKKKLRESYKPYRKSASVFVQRKGLHLRDLSFKPDYVIMGHTHFLDKYKIGKNSLYLNLSSWLDTICVKIKKGKMAFNVDKNCPFLVFSCNNSKVKYQLYNSSLQNMIKFPVTEKPIEGEDPSDVGHVLFTGEDN